MEESSGPPSGVASSLRRRYWLAVRALLSLGFVGAMFVALGAAALIPANVTLATYSTLADWQSWTYTGGIAASSTCQNSFASACAQISSASVGDTATSPAIAYVASGDAVSVAATMSTPGSSYATVALQASWDGGAYSTLASCAGGPCSGSTSAPSSGSTHTLVLRVSVTGGGSAGFGLMTVTDTTATHSSSPGTLSFPTLDLSAVATQMGAYFGFIAPGLWVVAGIGLGGMIVGRVRGLF